MKTLFSILLSAFSIAAIASPPKFYAYKIEPSDGGYLFPRGIDDSGRVVGTWQYYALSKPFITDPRGKNTRTIEFSDDITTASAIGINNRGVVVGYYVDRRTGGYSRSFVYTAAAGAKKLFDKALGQSDEPTGINDRNEIVGYSTRFDYERRIYINSPFVADPLGKVFPRPDLPESFYANAINNNGQIAGTAVNPDGGYYPLVTGPGGVGTERIGSMLGQAFAINSAGDVGGNFYDGVQELAFSTRRGAENVKFRSSPDIRSSVVYAIGPGGTMGGSFYPSSPTGAPALAFIANAKGPLMDLNDLIINRSGRYVKFISVVAINASMQAAVNSDDGAYLVCPTEDCL